MITSSFPLEFRLFFCHLHCLELPTKASISSHKCMFSFTFSSHTIFLLVKELCSANVTNFSPSAFVFFRIFDMVNWGWAIRRYQYCGNDFNISKLENQWIQQHVNLLKRRSSIPIALMTCLPTKSNQIYLWSQAWSFSFRRGKKLYRNSMKKGSLHAFMDGTICYGCAKIPTAGKQPRKRNVKMQKHNALYKILKQVGYPMTSICKRNEWDVCNLK